MNVSRKEGLMGNKVETENVGSVLNGRKLLMTEMEI